MRYNIQVQIIHTYVTSDKRLLSVSSSESYSSERCNLLPEESDYRRALTSRAGSSLIIRVFEGGKGSNIEYIPPKGGHTHTHTHNCHLLSHSLHSGPKLIFFQFFCLIPKLIFFLFFFSCS